MKINTKEEKDMDGTFQSFWNNYYLVITGFTTFTFIMMGFSLIRVWYRESRYSGSNYRRAPAIRIKSWYVLIFTIILASLLFWDIGITVSGIIGLIAGMVILIALLIVFIILASIGVAIDIFILRKIFVYPS